MTDELYIPMEVLKDERLAAETKIIYGCLLSERQGTIWMDGSVCKRHNIPENDLMNAIIQLVNQGYIRLRGKAKHGGLLQVIGIELQRRHIKKAEQEVRVIKYRNNKPNPNQITLF